MKKTLLTLTAIAMMVQNADAMYVIGNPFGKWDPGVGAKMEETENGWQWTGYIPFFSIFGFATELKPGMDWDTFNNNYRLSPEDFMNAEDGNYQLHFGSPEAALSGLGRTCTLTVTKDEKGKYSVSVKNKEMPEEGTWGVIGDFNSWDYDNQILELNPNIWYTLFNSIEGNFKFRANQNWAIQYGAADSFTISGAGQFPILQDGDPFNCEELNLVAFILDLNSNQLTVKTDLSSVSPLALRGEVTDWSWDGKYCMTEIPGSQYVYSVTLPSIQAGMKFKLADLDWHYSYSTQNLEMKLGETYGLTENGWENMAFAESYDGPVIIQYDKLHNTIRAIADPNAVESIEATDDKTIYYNLQGVKVENPNNGVFIRVSNGKTEKVLMK